MRLFWLSYFIVVGSNVSYHILQRSITKSAHPIVSLIVTYCVSILACLCLLPFFPIRPTIGMALKNLNWASFALGLAIVGVEAGYLLFYRSGWFISHGSILCNLLVAIILVPIGVWAFRESLSASRLVGIGLAILGLYLILKK